MVYIARSTLDRSHERHAIVLSILLRGKECAALWGYQINRVAPQLPLCYNKIVHYWRLSHLPSPYSLVKALLNVEAQKLRLSEKENSVMPQLALRLCVEQSGD